MIMVSEANGYDAEDRLVGWNRTDNKLNQSWNLSLVGDWQTFTENGTAQTRTHDAVHALTKAGSALSYGPKGNLGIDKTKSPVRGYSWDADNRLSGADINNDGTNELQFTYDALGRRVSKTVSGGATTVYVSLQQQELVEYTANAPATSLQRKFIYTDSIDEPVVMINSDGSYYYYHANNLGSVAVLTNQAGAVIERYAYSSHGVPVILNASGQVLTLSSIGNPYLYTARRYDPETGLYYYRARYYDPLLGRFISRDPIGYLSGDFNLYRYVNNNPLCLSDPLGHSWWDPRTWATDALGAVQNAGQAVYNQLITSGQQALDSITEEIENRVTRFKDRATQKVTFNADIRSPTVDIGIAEVRGGGRVQVTGTGCCVTVSGEAKVWFSANSGGLIAITGTVNGGARLTWKYCIEGNPKGEWSGALGITGRLGVRVGLQAWVANAYGEGGAYLSYTHPLGEGYGKLDAGLYVRAVFSAGLGSWEQRRVYQWSWGDPNF